MSKKGQSIGINTIILIALALIVLIIVVVLVMRSGKDFSESTECVKKGGICKPAGECQDTADKKYAIGTAGQYCEDNNYICCSPIPRD